ncbi:MAG: CheY-like chemotaxis protein [Gammaproteobacteria bacterium]|jgi:CheY-like chemotaxis protein
MKKKRVLIVEDQSITAMDELQIMHDLGYEVTGIAMSGEDAIIQAHRDLPDVVLMDIKLSGEMDGREAALKIQERDKIPVVYVTAFGDKTVSVSGSFSMPDGIGYIVKPFTKEELKSEVERVLG